MFSYDAASIASLRMRRQTPARFYFFPELLILDNIGKHVSGMPRSF
jgi:hypothetical protein